MQKIVAWVPPKLFGLTLWHLQGRLRLNKVAQLPFGRGKAIGALMCDWRLGGTDSLERDENGVVRLTAAPIRTAPRSPAALRTFSKNPPRQRGFTCAFPGESGVRNPIRGDGYLATDLLHANHHRTTQNGVRGNLSLLTA